jgi:hypothetical protein
MLSGRDRGAGRRLRDEILVYGGLDNLKASDDVRSAFSRSAGHLLPGLLAHDLLLSRNQALLDEAVEVLAGLPDVEDLEASVELTGAVEGSALRAGWLPG